MGSALPRRSRSTPSCPNTECETHGAHDKGKIVRHGFVGTKFGRRRRYRCTACDRTFGKNTNTTYQRVQSPRTLFDRVVELRVEGMSIAAISRVCGLSWSTVFRWLKPTRPGVTPSRATPARSSGCGRRTQGVLTAAYRCEVAGVVGARLRWGLNPPTYPADDSRAGVLARR